MIQVPIHHFNFSDSSADTMMLWSAMFIFSSCDVNLEQKFEIKRRLSFPISDIHPADFLYFCWFDLV